MYNAGPHHPSYHAPTDTWHVPNKVYWRLREQAERLHRVDLAVDRWRYTFDELDAEDLIDCIEAIINEGA